MKNSLSVILLLIIFISPLYGQRIVCEVSSKFSNLQLSDHKYRFNDISRVLDFVSNLQGSNKRIDILLCDERYYISAPLSLEKNKIPITVKSKYGKAEIVSGIRINDVTQNGDTLIFPVGCFVSNISVNGNYIPLASTFTGASTMRQYKDFKSLGNNKYSAIFPKDELDVLERGCDVFVYCRWLCHKLKVESINKKTGLVTLFSEFDPVYASDFTAYYCIFNSRKCLKPNTFCFREGKVYYLINKSDRFRKIEIRVPNFSSIICLLDCKNISFENIIFKGAPVEEWYIKGVQGARNLSRAVKVQNSSNVCFYNCGFYNNDGYSLGMDNCSHCSVRGCVFTRLGGGGIALGFNQNDETHDIVIDNNLFKEIGRIHPGGEAIITFKAHNISITNNTICDGYYSGIGLGFTWGYGGLNSYNNYIANNHIHHLMRGVLSDGAGIYTLGNQKGTVIKNNYIHDIISRVFSESGSSLLYFDEGSSDIVAENNVMYGAHTGFHENYGRRNTLVNNVIAFTNLVAFRLSSAKQDTMLVANNNYVMLDAGNAYNKTFADYAFYKGNRTHQGVLLDKQEGLNIHLYKVHGEMDYSMDVNHLKRIGALKHSFKYGVKSKELKAMSLLTDEQIKTDKLFVTNSFPQVSDYFRK